MQRDSLQHLQAYLTIIRPYNALPLVLAYCIAASISGVSQHDIVVGSWIMFFLLGSITVWNDIEDLVIDKANRRSDGLAGGALSLPEAKRYYIGLFVAAFALCIALSRPIFGLATVAIFLVGGWIYNSRPLQVSRRPISSIVLLALLYGALPFGLGLALGKAITWAVALWALQRAGIVIMKDYKDETGDRLHHKQTFLIRFGPRAVARVSVALSLLASVGLVYMARNHASKIELGLLLVLAVIVIGNRTRLLTARTTARRMDIFKHSFYVQNICEGAALLWVLVRAS